MSTRKTSPKPTRSTKTTTKAKSTTKATPKSKSTSAKAKASTKTKSSKTKPAASKTKPATSKATPKVKKTTVAKKAATKSTAKKVSAKATAKKQVAKSEEVEVATISRRREERRIAAEAKSAAKKTTKPVAKSEAAPLPERREKVNRRRQIDPTTCERDYSELEVEFMNALDEYKRTSGRMFPTCSEVLEVIRDLGYAKLTPMELAARKALEPIVESESDDLEASVEADANEALEESLGFQSAEEESFELV